MREHATIRAGGVALIAGAAAFLGVFAFLAARFDYPDVLDGSAAEGSLRSAAASARDPALRPKGRRLVRPPALS